MMGCDYSVQCKWRGWMIPCGVNGDVWCFRVNVPV